MNRGFGTGPISATLSQLTGVINESAGHLVPNPSTCAISCVTTSSISPFNVSDEKSAISNCIQPEMGNILPAGQSLVRENTGPADPRIFPTPSIGSTENAIAISSTYPHRMIGLLPKSWRQSTASAGSESKSVRSPVMRSIHFCAALTKTASIDGFEPQETRSMLKLVRGSLAAG